MSGPSRDVVVAAHQAPTRPWALAALAATLILGLVAAGCGGIAATQPPSPSPSPSPTIATAKFSVTPAGGSRQAKPQNGITVRVKDGTLTSVRVTTEGDPVSGSLDPTATRWQSRWALNTATRYTVRATALDAAGRTVNKKTTFRTLTPHTTVNAEIFQGAGVTYGVGMPVMIAFSRPVENRGAVERALQLWSSKRVLGAWYWDGDQALWFRPRNYWPANTKVRFAGHFDGVQISPGVYGAHTLRQSFGIGRSLIVVASTTSHKAQVYLGRKRLGSWPISTGKPGKDTPNGTYLSMEKANPQHMVGADYDIQVPYSVRFTWSGNFLHAAPWSVGVQGYANVSHGCVNLSPEHAQRYYEMSIPGDPVTVTGSPRGGAWDDGWTVWFLSWTKLVRGNALHRAVRVGPDGSTWVRPGALKKSHAKAPLSRPKPENAAAG